MSELGTYTFRSFGFKSALSTESVFDSVAYSKFNVTEVTTDATFGYQTTTLSSAMPKTAPDSDVTLNADLKTSWEGSKEVTFVVACVNFPVGTWVTLISNEATPVVKLGPVQVTQPNFTTATKVNMSGDYEGVLSLKLAFDSGNPSAGATISVSPSVPSEDVPPGGTPTMIRIGEQTLAF